MSLGLGPYIRVTVTRRTKLDEDGIEVLAVIALEKVKYEAVVAVLVARLGDPNGPRSSTRLGGIAT